MGDKEKTLASVLFLVTGLLLPILFHSDSNRSQGKEVVQFYVHSALLELRIDASMEWIQDEVLESDGKQPGERPPEQEEQSATEEQVDSEKPENQPFFQVETWVLSTSELEDDRRGQVVREIAVAAAALGRVDDARSLLHEAQIPLGDDDPFAWIVNQQPMPGADRFEKDLGLTHLPDWLQSILRERYLSQQPLDATIRTHMEPFVTRIGSLAFVAIILFMAGLTLLIFLRKLLAKYALPGDAIGRHRFQAYPFQTYMTFLLWFLLSLTIGTVLSEMLSDGMSRAQAMLVTYTTVAGAGVYLVQAMGKPRGASLLRTVDADGHSLNRRAILFGIGGYLIAIPVVAFLSMASAALLGGGDSSGVNPAIPILVGTPGTLDRALIFINVALLAPLFEEFFFRGFLFRQFLRDHGKAHAVILSALIFSAVHLSIDSFIPLAGLGVVLALVYHYSQSMWAAVLTHGLWNLATLVSVLSLFG